MKRKFLFMILTAILLVSCTGSGETASTAVQKYFETLVGKDENKIVALSCAAWEGDARRDVLSFAQNPASAKDVTCHETGKDGDFTTVACTGKLIMDYNGDIQEIDLSKREYKAIQEGGSWRMCGYK